MFYRRLEKLCFDHGMTVGEACQAAGFHRSTHTVWKTGKKPSRASAEKLASLLGTTTEYLLDGIGPAWDNPDDGYLQSLLKEIEAMKPETRETLLQVARMMNVQNGTLSPDTAGTKPAAVT